MPSSDDAGSPQTRTGGEGWMLTRTSSWGNTRWVRDTGMTQELHWDPSPSHAPVLGGKACSYRLKRVSPCSNTPYLTTFFLELTMWLSVLQFCILQCFFNNFTVVILVFKRHRFGRVHSGRFTLSFYFRLPLHVTFSMTSWPPFLNTTPPPTHSLTFSYFLLLLKLCRYPTSLLLYPYNSSQLLKSTDSTEHI